MNEQQETVIAEENSTEDFPPLFEDEKIGESELAGEAETSPEKEAVAEADTKETEETPTESSETETLRSEVEYWKTQAMQQPETSDVAQDAEDAEFKDFEVLSDADFDELVEDDPDEATRYQHKLIKHNQWKEKKKVQEVAVSKAKQQEEALLTDVVESLQSAVPGIYDEDDPIREELTQFAIDNGIDENWLPVLTTPGTKVIPVGSKKAFTLGEGATSLIRMINKFYTASGKPKSIKSENQKESNLIGKELSEEDWGKLSGEEERAFLGG